MFLLHPHAPCISLITVIVTPATSSAFLAANSRLPPLFSVHNSLGFVGSCQLLTTPVTGISLGFFPVIASENSSL
jgi:hypothetical protein